MDSGSFLCGSIRTLVQHDSRETFSRNILQHGRQRLRAMLCSTRNRLKSVCTDHIQILLLDFLRIWEKFRFFSLVSRQWYGCQCLGLLTCVQVSMHATAHRGCTDTVRESALEVDWRKKWKKKYFRTGDSNPRQCALLCGVVSIESMKLGRILGRSVPFSSFISPVAFQVSSKRSFLQTVMSVAWKVANSSRRSPEAPDGCRHGDLFMK